MTLTAHNWHVIAAIVIGALIFCGTINFAAYYENDRTVTKRSTETLEIGELLVAAVVSITVGVLSFYAIKLVDALI